MASPARVSLQCGDLDHFVSNYEEPTVASEVKYFQKVWVSGEAVTRPAGSECWVRREKQADFARGGRGGE